MFQDLRKYCVFIVLYTKVISIGYDNSYSQSYKTKTKSQHTWSHQSDVGKAWSSSSTHCEVCWSGQLTLTWMQPTLTLGADHMIHDNTSTDLDVIKICLQCLFTVLWCIEYLAISWYYSRAILPRPKLLTCCSLSHSSLHHAVFLPWKALGEGRSVYWPYASSAHVSTCLHNQTCSPAVSIHVPFGVYQRLNTVTQFLVG